MTFKFEIGQTVEMVREQKDYDILANIVRRFIKDEPYIQHIVNLNLNENQDGDLFEVCDRHLKKDENNVEHDLYLCKKLKNQEMTLFGRSGLREQRV